MSAILKVYTDAGHTSEVAHTTQNATTTAGGTQNAGTTSLQVTSTANMPTQGIIDIIDGVNGNETIAYINVTDATHLALATATTHNHPISTTVNQWYYALAVGDQTNGILNDGTNAGPTGLNTGTWYIYNAGDQTAQNIVLSTSSASPSSTNGFTDTVISITSANSGFGTSLTPANLTAGSVQQIWIAEEVPANQGNTPTTQICVLNLTYQSV